MKKIRVILDYPCYPLWIYDEKNNLIDNALPIEIQNDNQLDNLLKEIQKEYNDLFENNEKSFEYKGFSNRAEKEIFLEKIDRVVNILNNKLSDLYTIENEVTLVNYER